MKFKRSIPYDILIRPTPNEGFSVKVGCVKVVYSGITKLIQDLKEYLENPEEVEKQYNDDIVKLDRIHFGSPPDIRVAPYGAGNTASGLSMLARNMLEKQKEIEKKAFPMKTPDKEASDEKNESI